MIRKAVLSCALLLIAWPALAQTKVDAALSGRWSVTLQYLGTPFYQRLDIEQKDGKISGLYGRAKIDGVVSGDTIHFEAKDDGGVEVIDGVLKAGILSGTGVDTSKDDPAHPVRYGFTAERAPQKRPGPPMRFDFVPTVFYRQFSALNKPVLTVSPGDTIHTTTVDAGGTDEKSVVRVVGGNPETGPFYVTTAMPGDTLAVHIVHLKLNRDWAISDDAIVPRGLDSNLAVKMKDGGKPVRWRLDLARQLAFVDKPGEHMAQYGVPVRPMLGCIATAPAPVGGAPPTGDSGSFGGNMDFNEIGEGATVYLPVSVPGALLYLGDAHALQGDGEINGNALETSMDVEFTVDVIPGRSTPAPRVESATHIMAMGLGGTLDDAFRAATANMAGWLADDYKLTAAETAEFIGSAAEYKVSEVADRNAGIVLKISKDRLAALSRAPAK